MKFCKKYEEYMQGQDQKKLPGVGFKKLKKILKKCRREENHFQSQNLDFHNHGDLSLHDSSTCPHQYCPVCDGTFFPSLLKEMSAVVGSFNERAQKLLELHLASGFRKCYIWFKDKLQRNHVALIEEGKDLVSYALINAIAMRKILKKYDKIHYTKQRQAFKSQVQSMHIEILQSPWLCELMAFYINLRETKTKTKEAPAFFDGCSLIFNNRKSSLSCELFESVKLDIDLTCSICLIGDIPDAEIKHPENVLFACKLNSVTEDEDLNTIFSRFGTVTSAEIIRDFKTGDSLCYAFIVGSKFIIGIDIIVFLHVVNTECMNSELPVNPTPPSEWLEDTLIKLYLPGYSKHAMDANCDTRTTSDERMPEETICRDSLSFSVDGTGNDDAHEQEGGEWIPDENDSSNNVLDEGAYQDEENWRAQYSQVIKPTKESVTDFRVVDLWEEVMRL